MAVVRYSSSGTSWVTGGRSRERTDVVLIPELQENDRSFLLAGIITVASFLGFGFQQHGEKEVHFPFTDLDGKSWQLALSLKSFGLVYTLFAAQEKQESSFLALSLFRQNSACIELRSPEEMVTIWKRDEGLEVTR